MTSANFELERKAQTAHMAGGVQLIFPAFDIYPELQINIGTRAFDGDDGKSYISGLKDYPSFQAAIGIGQDTSSFVLNDPTNSWYANLKLYTDVVEATKVVVKDFLRTENGFESETILTGYLTGMNYSDSEAGISFSAISDLARTGRYAGSRILTQRFCAAKFNVAGLLSPLVDPCGWQIDMGGNAAFCTHKRTGVDGCIDHNNQHRFFAVEGISTAPVTSTGLGGGWGYGHGAGCFTPKTLIWMADGSLKQISAIETGDVVWGFDDDGTVRKSIVGELEKTLVEGHLLYDLGKGRKLEPTFVHMMLVGLDQFKQADSIEVGECLRGFRGIGVEWTDIVLRNLEYKEKYGYVHNFQSLNTQTYFVVVDDLFIGVHNRKPDIL